MSYARIRYTEGDDFKRSERQRIVLQQVVEKAKKAALPTLNKIVDQVLPQVSTNLSTSDFLGIAASAAKYKIAEMKGYPFDVTTSEDVVGLEGILMSYRLDLQTMSDNCMSSCLVLLIIRSQTK